jgi:uncharacterized protein YciI
MVAPLPPAISIEPIFLIEATYAPDATETRAPFRARHLARIVELRDAGIVIEAGAYSDVSASILLVRAVDAEAAAEVVRQDVYMRNGVWVELRVRPFGRVCRSEELPGPVPAG